MTDDEDDDFRASREGARDLLADESVDALYVAVTRDDEMDFAFAHRFDEPEKVGMRALSLLAKHVQVVAEESGLSPEQVGEDAARLAGRIGEGESGEE